MNSAEKYNTLGFLYTANREQILHTFKVYIGFLDWLSVNPVTPVARVVVASYISRFLNHSFRYSVESKWLRDAASLLL